MQLIDIHFQNPANFTTVINEANYTSAARLFNKNACEYIHVFTNIPMKCQKMKNLLQIIFRSYCSVNWIILHDMVNMWPDYITRIWALALGIGCFNFFYEVHGRHSVLIIGLWYTWIWVISSGHMFSVSCKTLHVKMFTVTCTLAK